MWTAMSSDKHLSYQPMAHLELYPQAQHLPVCGDCGGPWPCQQLRIDAELERDQQRSARFEIAGVCPGCGEPVTGQQLRQTWPVNLYAADEQQPVTFHLRQSCVDAARSYDRECMARGHESRLGYEKPAEAPRTATGGSGEDQARQ